ncbi:ABC transporter permease [Desulfocicer niacini]
MIGYITRRILYLIPVALFVSVFVFLMLRMAPGDPAAVIAGNNAMPKDIERIRVKLGLDLPIHRQFIKWSGGLIKGDLGTSIYSGVPVSKLIISKLEPTCCLAVASIIIAVLVAVPLGVIAAVKSKTMIDYGVMLVAVLGFSVPVFIIGYILIYLFALKWHLFPVQGFVGIRHGFVPFLRSITLPSLSLGLIYSALIARITRASMIEVLSEDYVRTAKAKGLGNIAVVCHHAMKNAAVPIVTIIGLGVALLVGGVVVTESVFNIPGLGRLVVDSVLARDYPVIQGVVLFFSAVFLIINLAVDISYGLFDPRLRYRND